MSIRRPSNASSSVTAPRSPMSGVAPPSAPHSGEVGGEALKLRCNPLALLNCHSLAGLLTILFEQTTFT